MGGVKIEGVVSWHEGQPIQKALYLGLNRNYPHVKIRGYQGFSVPMDYLCAKPTESEIRNNLAPDELHIATKQGAKAAYDKLIDIDIIPAPAFRYGHLFSLRWSEERNGIVFFLPITVSGSVAVIKGLASLLRTMTDHHEFQIFLKYHPVLPKNKLRKYFPDVDDYKAFETLLPASELLQQATAVVSTVSSVCVESAALGLSTIVISSNVGRPSNPIPDNLRHGCTLEISSPDQLNRDLLVEVLSLEKKLDLEDTYNRVTPDGTSKLFVF